MNSKTILQLMLCVVALFAGLAIMEPRNDFKGVIGLWLVMAATTGVYRISSK